MARGGGKDIVLDDPALKLKGHLSVLATRAAAEHPAASTGHARGAYVSALRGPDSALPTDEGTRFSSATWPFEVPSSQSHA